MVRIEFKPTSTGTGGHSTGFGQADLLANMWVVAAAIGRVSSI